MHNYAIIYSGKVLLFTLLAANVTPWVDPHLSNWSAVNTWLEKGACSWVFQSQLALPFVSEFSHPGENHQADIRTAGVHWNQVCWKFS